MHYCVMCADSSFFFNLSMDALVYIWHVLLESSSQMEEAHYSV